MASVPGKDYGRVVKIMKKVLYKIYSVRDYDKDFIGQQGTFVRIDQLLCDESECQELDSTVYPIDVFEHIHKVYLMASAASKFMKGKDATFQYDYSVYTKYVDGIRNELIGMQ